MGKSRARKTRWRALNVADENSDSEESTTNSSAISNGYYSKYSHSSQSTPARRRYLQYNGSTKSTRSSSTTSENKITFNEDEYTRITTPRQDVLFKKGYLNKPKSYHAQTSTGNSTISTENGTPDHQSTDLDYESQFVFPNGFVDQNGIYYVNSYEPYPVMVINPSPYYQDYTTTTKSKRYSTGSLSESTSPNNEEATSQDMSHSGGEASNNVSDYSGGPIYSMVYPGYYVNGDCTPTGFTNGQSHSPEPVKKLKKRRERKSSKNIPEDSDENSSSCDENAQSRVSPVQEELDLTSKSTTNSKEDLPKTDSKTDLEKTSSVLKPDAEEFVPRAYQNVHIKLVPPPNFVPFPIVPHHAFLAPPPIHLNFIPPPGFVNYPPPPIVHEAKIEEIVVNQYETEGVAKETIATPSQTPQDENNTKPCALSKSIDIASVVSKLEAVKLQENEQNSACEFRKFVKQQHFKRYNGYNSGNASPQVHESPRRFSGRNGDLNSATPARNSPERFRKVWIPNGTQNNKGYQSPMRTNTNCQIFTVPVSPSKKCQVKPPLQPESPKPKSSNQWISVSSRKKKKNKTLEESDDFKEGVPDEQEPTNENSLAPDQFETYDVSQLVDVVPPTKQQTSEEKRIEDILTTIAQNEVVVNNCADLEIPEVSEIEKDIIPVKVEEKREDKEEGGEAEVFEEVVVEAPQDEKEEEESFKPKKKSKKGTEKPLMKKVIITDIHVGMTVEEPKTPTKKVVKKVEVKKVEEPQPIEPVEKKPKKKKKNKPLAKPSNNSSKLTNNTATEDSYDFVLPNQDKTNDEISQELDKLIQKGIYNSLQEKIKSINVQPESDAFFRSVPSLDIKQKNPDYNRIFQSTRQLLKPNMVSVESDSSVEGAKIDSKCSSSCIDAADTSPGPVLESKVVPEVQEVAYPVTEAVKQWIKRTKDSTPEVEVLKSPSTLRKEFGDLLDSDSDPDSDTESELDHESARVLPYRAVCCSLQ